MTKLKSPNPRALCSMALGVPSSKQTSSERKRRIEDAGRLSI